ncbi:MAG: LytTR family DNA-binding domain-containing protein, partial [Pseudomonadota bacterium]
MSLSPFYEAATLWQLLQGVIIYAAMQGLIYGRWLQERLQATRSALDEALHRTPEASNAELDSVFVKADGEFRKIDLEDLIHLEADGDQVQLHTRQGHFACNKSLSDYAQKLEDSGYIRIHRSHLVRANAIISAEPTGDGRLSIHLSSGASIVASRTGTRAFRQ